jgi:putative flippase GtrA
MKKNQKIMEKVKKVLNKEVIFYLIFGVLSTIINLGSFYILNTLLSVNENLANFIAIILAVLFAYFTNKDLVFHSEVKTFKDKIIQFLKFMSGRAFTLAVEFFGGLLLFKIPIPNMITKTFLTVIVVILNYFISKYFAFNSKSKDK